MKEFIEKLIGRLEEEKEQYKRARGNTHCVITETSECDSCRADHYLYARLRCIDRTIEIVNQLAEEYGKDKNVRSNGWIPCSRELPPQPKENPAFDNKALQLYLVSDGYSDYPFRAFWNGKFFVDGFSHVDVIAWMPLPEPYSVKEEEQKGITI